MKLGIILAAGALVVGASAFAATGPAGGWGKDKTTWKSASGTGESIYDAVYDPDSGQGSWVLASSSTPSGFDVSADVEMWASWQFNASNIYFHIGGDLGSSPSLTQDVGGTLVSNNGQYVFITKKSGDGPPTQEGLSNLNLKNDMFGRTPADDAIKAYSTKIPVKWSVTDSKGLRDLVWSADGNGGLEQGFMFLLDNGEKGAHSFTIHCTITPEQYQQDGHYEMDPTLVATPVM